MIKRFRVGGEEVEVESINMANMLMLLSQSGSSGNPREENPDQSSQLSSGRVFECKTCNRQFPSFQALGGHRASHKKSRLSADGQGGLLQSATAKPKMHECSICGLEFAIGQALGGHMRRHRAATEGFGHGLLEKKSHGRRVFCLDLNLPPAENDDEWLKIGSGIETVDKIRMVDCFH